ncbi:hypothetical protein [Halosegnis sp.]|uniref:hypothetical protein n=1 Tax=Halosegnis sp. TaxID=2864959 RepID=UPI0035D4486A
MTEASERPADRLGERADESRWKLWLLLQADRRLVAGGLLVGVFLALLAVGTLLPGAGRAIRTGDPIETTFQALLAATITGVTVVLTLNQLVLSQELGAVGDQRERMEAALAFREDAAAAIDAPVAPARPAQFLRAFVEVAAERARNLQAAVPEEGALATAVDPLVDGLATNADRVSASLDGAKFGEFDVVAAALDFNYSWKVFAARRIEAHHGDELNPAAAEALTELRDVLELFGPAREHFKTLYFQWELVDLSRAVLATALPALVVSACMLGFFETAVVDTTVAGLNGVVLAYAAAVTVVLAPFAILLVYVVRIATVTKRTLSVGPFILRETDWVDEVEWDR